MVVVFHSLCVSICNGRETFVFKYVPSHVVQKISNHVTANMDVEENVVSTAKQAA